MTVRLQLGAAPERLILDETERVVVPSSIAVAAASDSMGQAAREFRASALRAIAKRRPGRVARGLELVQRTRSGTERIEESGVTILRASGDRIRQALSDWIGLDTRVQPCDDEETSGISDESGCVVAGGLSFVALARPDLSIVLAPSESLVHWDPFARELRDRFTIVLYEARASLAEELVTRWLNRRCG